MKGDGDNLRLSEQFMTGAWWRLPLEQLHVQVLASTVAALPPSSIALSSRPAAYNEPIYYRAAAKQSLR